MKEWDVAIWVAIIGLIGIVIKATFDFYSKNKMKKNWGNSFINKDFEIDELLWKELDENRVKHLYVCQYHNGGNYKSGDSILKFTMTNEAIIEGNGRESVISSIKEKYLSEFTVIFKKLFFDKFCEGTNYDNLQQKKYERIMGSSNFYLFSIEDSKKTMGFLGVHYEKNEKMQESERKYFSLLASRIASIIS